MSAPDDRNDRQEERTDRLDDDAVSDAWIDARTKALARSRDARQVSSDIAVVRVRAAGASYALDLRWLRAVRSLRKLARLPHAPAHVAGLTSFEGAVVPVFHLSAVLGAPLSTLPERGQMVVLGGEGDLVGAAVDEVGESTNVDLNILLPAPSTFPERLRMVVQGVTPDGVVLLDAAALLASDRLIVGIPTRFARPGQGPGPGQGGAPS